MLSVCFISPRSEARARMRAGGLVARLALELLPPNVDPAQVTVLLVASPFRVPPVALMPSADVQQWRLDRVAATATGTTFLAVSGGLHDWQVPERAAAWPTQVCRAASASWLKLLGRYRTLSLSTCSS